MGRIFCFLGRTVLGLLLILSDTVGLGIQPLYMELNMNIILTPMSVEVNLHSKWTWVVLLKYVLSLGSVISCLLMFKHVLRIDDV
jgi:hypothetical protein